MVEPDEEVLQGGVANAGAVVRVGADVLRPSNEHSPSILEFLSELRSNGFRGAPDPVGLEADGRERLRFIPGKVAIPPYPGWIQTDDSLRSIAELIRTLHDASVGVAVDVRAGCVSYAMRMGSTRRAGRTSCAPSTGPSHGAASSSGDELKQGSPDSCRCGRSSAEWNASTGADDGGRRLGHRSTPHCSRRRSGGATKRRLGVGMVGTDRPRISGQAAPEPTDSSGWCSSAPTGLAAPTGGSGRNSTTSPTTPRLPDGSGPSSPSRRPAGSRCRGVLARRVPAADGRQVRPAVGRRALASPVGMGGPSLPLRDPLNLGGFSCRRSPHRAERARRGDIRGPPTRAGVRSGSERSRPWHPHPPLSGW